MRYRRSLGTWGHVVQLLRMYNMLQHREPVPWNELVGPSWLSWPFKFEAQGVDIKKENYDKTGAATMTISRQEAMSGLLAPSASRIGLKAWKRNMESDSWHKSRMKQPCQRNLASGHGRKGAHKKTCQGKMYSFEPCFLKAMGFS